MNNFWIGASVGWVERSVTHQCHNPSKPKRWVALRSPRPAVNHIAAIVLLCLAFACTAAHAERADRNKPVHLEANQVSIDDARQISTFEGNVLLTQGTLAIRGDRIVVIQGKDGFAHGTATGQPASFRQKRDGSDEYVEGYGERIEYDTQSEVVNFFGQARMTRQQDEVRGEHITYSSKTEIFQVRGAPGDMPDASGKGRVRVTIQPKGAARTPLPEPLQIKPAGELTQPETSGHE